jgi:uncharacterized repeat protein (TIGR01451 family)
MAPRGIWQIMSARTKRSLVLAWGALFVLSLLLQYVNFAVAQPVLAAHDEGLFELDGNANDSNTNEPDDDWSSVNHAIDDLFVGAPTEAGANDATYFTGGGSKDVNDIDEWAYTANDVAPDKDQITDAYAAAYQKGGDTFVYFGADRFDGSGDSFIGFWFFQHKIGLDGSGGFKGTHAVGDVLVVSDFTNGGAISTIKIYEWDGNGLDLVASGAECDVPGDHEACAVVNSGNAAAPWAYTDKDGDHDFAAGAFYEGGINLDDIFPNGAPCFAGFLAETRSSQSTTAQLKDFALGSLTTCAPPDIETQVSDATVDFGGNVTDTATLSGNSGEVTGSVEFFLCGPASAAPSCASGGDKIGDAVTLGDGEATSDAFTVPSSASAVGHYCFRVEYTPDDAADYLAAEHTNKTSECFNVAAASIDVAKTADAATVAAGDPIGFTVTLSNTGDGTATGVAFTDALPGGDGVDWSISPASTGWSISGTVPSQSLVYAPTSLAPGASTSVHVVSDTTTASCKRYDNTASATTSNDGSDRASASVVVACPGVSALSIVKSVDGASGGTDPVLGVPAANAGDTLTYTLEYTGVGELTTAIITDVIPVGLDYVDGSAAGDASFNFLDYDDATRTLTWTAASLPDPANGTVTYEVTVRDDAADQPQPLINVATIASDQTDPDDDEAAVAVLPPVEALTPPPTSTIAAPSGSSNPGFALMLILLAIAAVGLTVGFVTPVPARLRRR